MSTQILIWILHISRSIFQYVFNSIPQNVINITCVHLGKVERIYCYLPPKASADNLGNHLLKQRQISIETYTVIIGAVNQYT